VMAKKKLLTAKSAAPGINWPGLRLTECPIFVQWRRFKLHPLARNANAGPAALQRSKDIPDEHEDEWKVIAEYAANHQRAMHIRLLMIFTHKPEKNYAPQGNGNAGRF
jgi:hypothetical protein